MVKKDFYKILGIVKNATCDEVRKAFRILANKYHPDKNDGDKVAEEQFIEVLEAYEILNDETKRNLYDQEFKIFESAVASAKRKIRLGSIFSLFSSDVKNSYQKKSYQPQDTIRNIEIPFLLSVKGGRETITISQKRICINCNGTGANPGNKMNICPKCAGKGEIIVVCDDLRLERTCDVCKGCGKIYDFPCLDCSGTGFIDYKKKITVDIPHGISDGETVRLKGEGEFSPVYLSSNNLIIKIKVKPHPFFTREGNNINSIARIDLRTAIFGGNIKILTIDGTSLLNIPSGTESGANFCLEGKGVSRIGMRAGDHIVTVFIESPNDPDLFRKSVTKPIYVTYICKDEFISDLICKFCFHQELDIGIRNIEDVESLGLKKEIKTDILIIDVENEGEFGIIQELINHHTFLGCQIFLLCSKNEVNKIQALMQDGKIEDYFIVRPLCDPVRMQIQIKRAIEKATIKQILQAIDEQENLTISSESDRPLLYKLNYNAYMSKILDQTFVEKNFSLILKTVRSILKILGQDEKNIKKKIRFSFGGMHTLVIEDDPPSAELMKDLLIAEGFEVDSVQSIEKACLNYYENLFDIIFVDLRLPGVSEAEGIRFLKQNIKSAHSPIIVTTAYSEKELVLDCINEGISDYLIKPITRGTLMPRVASVLGVYWEEKI